MTPRERFIAAREALHLNQSQLARKINVSSQLVSQIENEKVNLSWQTARIIQAELGISAQWLLYGEGEMTVRDRERFRETPAGLSGNFDFYPAIVEMLNRITARMSPEDWDVLNRYCLRILRPERKED